MSMSKDNISCTTKNLDDVTGQMHYVLHDFGIIPEHSLESYIINIHEDTLTLELLPKTNSPDTRVIALYIYSSLCGRSLCQQ